MNLEVFIGGEKSHLNLGIPFQPKLHQQFGIRGVNRFQVRIYMIQPVKLYFISNHSPVINDIGEDREIFFRKKLKCNY